MNKEVFIFSAYRSPIGAFLGKFKNLPAHDLSAPIIKHIMYCNKLSNEQIDELIVGQILTAGSGQNPARQLALNAGLSDQTISYILNQVCGSGLKSVILGALNIAHNNKNLILAGGQENMSLCPYAMNLRQAKKMGHSSMIDLMIHDGLTDAFSQQHMGITAENIAKKYNIERDIQDDFALLSINKYLENKSKFASEIVEIAVNDQENVKEDECTKLNFDKQKLVNMKAAFLKEGGTVTAGNASSINDGSAFVLLGHKDSLPSQKPLAKIVAFAESGIDPQLMGLSPIQSIKKAVQNAGWNLADIDLFEINEAFAVQTLAIIQELKLDIEKVNVNGGAIVLGHPIGASGARCLVTLIHAMQKRQAQKGVVSLCIGGGMGIAMCIELC